MAYKVAIHGLGVVGRELLRTLWGRAGIEVVMLNDSVLPTNLKYLLEHDTIYHDWRSKHEVTAAEDSITIDGKQIEIYSETDVRNLPLGGRGVDLVIDCSGTMKNKGTLQGFIDAGARRVMACYYIGNDLQNIVYGVNQNCLEATDTIISFAPMETQVLANILKPVNDCFEVETAIVKAIRSYTNAQPSIDSYDPENFALGRAAAWNITPTGDEFARYLGLVVPELNGKVIGNAYRAPVINGSVLDITAVLSKPTTSEDINKAMKACSRFYEYCIEPLCSSDAMSFDRPQFLANSTMLSRISYGQSMISLSVVYDSVRGYCMQILGFLMEVASGNCWE